MILHGGCHCGAMRFSVQWPESAPVPARRCGCSYCTGFGGTWTSHPDARLEIRHQAAYPPSRYRFETGTADFLFCSRCGVTVAALDDNSDALRAVVNIRALDAYEDTAFDCSDSDFDGEPTPDRLARRSRNWIGHVSLLSETHE